MTMETVECWIARVKQKSFPHLAHDFRQLKRNKQMLWAQPNMFYFSSHLHLFIRVCLFFFLFSHMSHTFISQIFVLWFSHNIFCVQPHTMIQRMRTVYEKKIENSIKDVKMDLMLKIKWKEKKGVENWKVKIFENWKNILDIGWFRKKDVNPNPFL